MKCNKCGSTKVKVSKNYSHGKRSRAMTKRICKDCGSADIYVEEKRFGRRR